MSPVDALTPQTYEKLQCYVTMLDDWRRVTNLISERAFADIWTRHIADGVCIQRLAPHARIWLDVGSGAGLPAVIIAAILADLKAARVICVEPDSRKCAFLREVATQIAIPIKVFNTRIQSLSIDDTGQVDVVTAKAFASIGTLLALTERYMIAGAPAILPRGRTYLHDLKEVNLRCYEYSDPSKLEHSDGAIVSIRMRGDSQ